MYNSFYNYNYIFYTITSYICTIMTFVLISYDYIFMLHLHYQFVLFSCLHINGYVIFCSYTGGICCFEPAFEGAYFHFLSIFSMMVDELDCLAYHIQFGLCLACFLIGQKEPFIFWCPCSGGENSWYLLY